MLLPCVKTLQSLEVGYKNALSILFSFSPAQIVINSTDSLDIVSIGGEISVILNFFAMLYKNASEVQHHSVSVTEGIGYFSIVEIRIDVR